jgi:hypothetical protein
VTTDDELLAAVGDAFEVTGAGCPSWADPHPDRSPLEEEYSRVTDPGRWRIVGARAEAWLIGLETSALATVERNVEVRWRVPPATEISRADRLLPRATGAAPLVIARSRIGDVDDAGVTLGVGNPAVCVAWFPACGCDACDGGSDYELHELDEHILGVISGAFRRLSADDHTITVISDARWSASGMSPGQKVDEILANPSGWHEMSGSSWLRT